MRAADGVALCLPNFNEYNGVISMYSWAVNWRLQTSQSVLRSKKTRTFQILLLFHSFIHGCLSKFFFSFFLIFPFNSP